MKKDDPNWWKEKADPTPVEVPAELKKPESMDDRYYDQRAFDDPARVVICKRRQRRREIMFALKKTGKGSGAKKRRINERSKVRC